LFGCRVTDYGDDDFEIVASCDRWRHKKKMWIQCDIVSSGHNGVKGGHWTDEIKFAYIGDYSSIYESNIHGVGVDICFGG